MVRQDSLSELFWAAFKQSRNPMVLLDHPRRIVEANGACLKLLGYTRNDLVGKPGLPLRRWWSGSFVPRVGGTAGRRSLHG